MVPRAAVDFSLVAKNQSRLTECVQPAHCVVIPRYNSLREPVELDEYIVNCFLIKDMLWFLEKRQVSRY